MWSERWPDEPWSFNAGRKFVVRALTSVLGPVETGKIGPWLVDFDGRDLKGILRVRRGEEGRAKAALSMYRRDPSLGRVFVEVLGTSGTIKGARRFFKRLPKREIERLPDGRALLLYEGGQVDILDGGRVVEFTSHRGLRG